MKTKRLFVFFPFLDSVANWLYPIMPFFSSYGYEVTVLHMHRLSYGIAGDSRKADDKLKYIDLSNSGAKNIERILVDIDPDAVVFFGHHSLSELIILVCAQAHGIKTIFVQHGAFEGKRFSVVSKRSSAMRYARLLTKYATMSSFLDSPIIGIRRLIDFARLSQYRLSTFDGGVFYSRYNYERINHELNIPEANAVFAGFPMYSEAAQIGHIVDERDAPIVLYLKQHMIPKLSAISSREELDYFARISGVCADAGYRLVVRLHPRDSRDFYETAFSDRGVDLDHSESLLGAINHAVCVVSQSSTALFGAVKLRKPIIDIFYPGFCSYTDTFAELACAVPTYESLELTLRDLPAVDEDKYSEFEERYVGYKNSYQEQAESIISLIEGK